MRTIVFRAFHGVSERAAPSCDHGLDHARRRAKCRRKLRGVERREPPAGSRADVKQSPALLQGARNRLHGARNRGKRGLNGLRHGRILAMNRAQNLDARISRQSRACGDSAVRCSVLMSFSGGLAWSVFHF